MIDPAIIRVIEKRFSAKVSGLSLLGKGLCNSVYCFTVSDKKYCVKVERADKETDEQNDIIVEAHAIEAIFQKGVAEHVPEIFLVDTENRLYVYDFFEGISLEKFPLKNREETEKLFFHLGAFHAGLDCLSKAVATEIGLVIDEAGAAITSFFSDREISSLPKDWKEKWRQAVARALDISAAKKSDHFQCIHNDAHNGNIFISSDTNNFRVIDFGDAMYGDAHLDFVSYIHAYPDYWRFVVEGYEQVSGKSLLRERLIALALLRHLKGLLKMWNNPAGREHVTAKLNYYCQLFDQL